jgi:hypothetical protein
MAGARLGAVLEQIQGLFAEGSSTGFSDTQLLNRFATRRDEAAFAAIVARHGPMVLTRRADPRPGRRSFAVRRGDREAPARGSTRAIAGAADVSRIHCR